ncbi:YaaA family protein [Brevibacterium album]|uniref:YaaA family protein n=1 Tax=Brevibacterium album TaxID=417948 RepID=UPI000415F57B|nr:peroxide stress protein YaaA [Brevibacterium album]
MKILLPPSEGKTAPAAGPSLDLSALSFPQLAASREEVLAALVAASAEEDALATLDVGAGLAAEVEANTRLQGAASAPAHDVYSGVLYAAMEAGGVEAHRLEEVFVSSALFGVVNLMDPIPAYRLSMGTALPPLGRMRTWWKKRLATVLDEAFGEELVLDCRSADYRASWPGRPAHTITVDVVQIRNGQRKVVSHFAKHTRGELAGRLLRAEGPLPETAEDLVEASSHWYDVEYTAPTARKAASLTVVLPEG